MCLYSEEPTQVSIHLKSNPGSSVVAPHHFDADPDSTYLPDADPDYDFYLFFTDPDF
jgi:hypothetical protein